MGIYSSGSGHKSKAQSWLNQARTLEGQQNDIEFQRNLLSNIRQERIARAQLELGNTSSDYVSSSAAGALANIDSSLAGEMKYSYETSARAEKIQQYQENYKSEMKKYAKQQKKRATAFAITGMAAGALTGGALGIAGLAGGMSVGTAAITGAQIGQGLGQIASNTGQAETGIQNIIGGIKTGIRDIGIKSSFYNALKDMGMVYQTEDVDPATSKVIANSQQLYYYSPTAGKAVPIVKGLFS